MYLVKIQKLDDRFHGSDVALPTVVATVGRFDAASPAGDYARMLSRFDYVIQAWTEVHGFVN